MRPSGFYHARPGLAMAISAALAIAVVGCDTELPPEPPQGPTFVEVYEQVIAPDCAGCHSGNNPAGGLDLSADAAYGNIVGVPSLQVPALMLVEEGNAVDSYLFIKIKGGERIAPGTFQMPIGGHLEDDQVELVGEWISAGAQP